MKKLSGLIIFLFFTLLSFSQSGFPNNQSVSNASTLYHAKGGLVGDSGLVVIQIADTATANAGAFLKGTNGLLIRVNDTLFMRDVATSRWVKFIGGSSSVINFTGVDSVTFTNNCLYFWSGGLGDQFCLGAFYDSVSLNLDSTYMKFWNKGNFMDSIWLPHDNVYAIAPLYIDTYTSVNDPKKDSVVWRIDTTGFSTGGTVIDTTVQWAVDSVSNYPNTASNTGDKVLVGTSPTGVFIGHNNQIATYDSTTITFTYQSASIGDLLYNVETGYVYKWTGAVWQLVGRLVLHQAGDRYGVDVVGGAIDNNSFSFLQHNIIRGRFDKTTKDLTLSDSVGIRLFQSGSNPSEALFFGDNFIRDNGGGTMQFSEYVGQYSFLHSGTTQIAFLGQYGNKLIAPTLIGSGGDITANAVLDLQDTGRALIIPRMTAVQRLRLSSDIDQGSITAAGSAYSPNGVTFNVPLVNLSGIGINGTAHITVTAGAVTAFTISNKGRYYAPGDQVTISLGGGTGFVYDITTTGSIGMQVFDLDSLSVFQWTGTVWQNLYNISSSAGNTIYTGNDAITGGDRVVSLAGNRLDFSDVGGTELTIRPDDGDIMGETPLGKRFEISDDNDRSGMLYDGSNHIFISSTGSTVTGNLTVYNGSYDQVKVDPANDTIVIRGVHADGFELIKLGDNNTTPKILMRVEDSNGPTTVELNIGNGGVSSNGTEVNGGANFIFNDGIQGTTSQRTITNITTGTSTTILQQFQVGDYPLLSLGATGVSTFGNVEITDTAINIATPILRINGVLYNSAGSNGLAVYNESFTGSTSTTLTLSQTYIAGSVRVTKNGVRVTEFTEDGGNTITLTLSRLTGDTYILDFNY